VVPSVAQAAQLVAPGVVRKRKRSGSFLKKNKKTFVYKGLWRFNACANSPKFLRLFQKAALPS